MWDRSYESARPKPSFLDLSQETMSLVAVVVAAAAAANDDDNLDDDDADDV